MIIWMICMAAITAGGWLILTSADHPGEGGKVKPEPSPAIAGHPEEPPDPDPITPGSEDWWDPTDPSIIPEKKTTTKDKKKPVIQPPPTTSSRHILHNNWQNPDLNRLPMAETRTRGTNPSIPQLSNPPVRPAPFERPPDRRLQVAVRIPYWDPAATERLEQVADQINELNYPWYDIQSDGTLILRKADEASRILEIAEKNNIRLLPIIGNQYSPILLHEMLNQPEKRNRLIQEIVHTVLKQGYAGVELQFEPILEEDHDAFSHFVEELAAQLHEQQRWLSVALHPKTGTKRDTPSQCAQDWRRVGKAADSVKIMTYHYSLEKPGPAAPQPWLEEVLKRATSDMPAKKIYVSLSTQGYIWTGPDRLGPLTFNDAQNLIHTHNVSLQRNGDQPWFQYPVGKQIHTGYYQDAVGYGQKLRFLLEHHPDLAGIAHWYLGAEDPDTWKIIREANKRNR
jgi:spore germination protein